MGLVVTALTAWLACRRELRDAPSQLMRPKAPKPGKRIFLERTKLLWKSFTFSQKVTARNLFRYKKRFFMTVIGIAGCTALLLAGFGLNDSIGRVVDRQFRQIFTYNIDIRYKADAGDNAKTRVGGLLGGDANVASFMGSAEINAKARSSGDDIAVTLVVPSGTAELGKYITLRNASTGQPITLGAGGAVITEKLAKELGVGRGDTMELDDGNSRKKVVIADIAENYIFHYVYMSPDAYKSTFHLDADLNCVMVKLADGSAKAEDAMAQKLISDGSVASVTFYSSLASTFRQTVKSLDTVILVIILCAGLLAFVVLYNLTNINIGERIREIATVKVLGFRNREVSAYVFRENIILAVIGVLIGLPLGILLHSYIMTTLEQPGIMFGHYISWLSYLWSVLITAGFTGVVILVMGFRLRSIPMVESLKSVE
jgi:putative ABC transport system permease protein